ncbi:MAG: peptidylprolyl isomerase [Planctomycetes bacterium]|nr:peptidylprolyl isomerase [Planctomycetota bacterium]
MNDLSRLKQQWQDELTFREEDAKKKNPRLVLETSQGKVVLELFEDDAPNTVAALVSLAQKGFYNGLTFHRFVENFVIQGGCPKGDGTGDPGYRLKSEISRRNHFRGMVGMACSRPKAGTEGSQFYICLSDAAMVKNLSGSYVIVGRVIEGMEAAEKLRAGDKMTKVTAENLRDHEYKPETLPPLKNE